MSGGTFNVSRDLWDDVAFANEPFTEREAWIWLVKEASWKPRERRVGRVVVQTARGQLAQSVRFMAEAWQWSKSRVHRYLKRLEGRDMLRTESGTGLLVVTICNYDKYQGVRDARGTPAGQLRDSSGTNEKKGERRGKEGEIEEPCGSLSDPSPEPSFTARPVNVTAEAVAEYNRAAASNGWPQVQKMTPTRTKALRSRLKDCGGMDGWRHALKSASQSDFLCGRTARPWSGFGFDWLVKSQNFTKLMEGNYANRDHHHATATGRQHPPRAGGYGSGTVDAFAAVAAQMQQEQAGG